MMEFNCIYHRKKNLLMTNDFPWSKKQILQFQQQFLDWYNIEKRDLPWRDANNPYYTWISEIMLQQTQVVTVIPYFKRFIATFPTISSLAKADDNHLLKMWEGLGYYSRARNLKIAANEIMTNFNGNMPTNIDDILSLKGIGPYTAGAIASIAFNQPEPAIDGNVFRVVSRWLKIADDISAAKTRKVFDREIRILLPSKQPGDFNQAMMDLGSSICTPTSPKCSECPVADFCESFKDGNTLNYPVKTKKNKVKQVYYFATIYSKDESLLLEQRPDSGLLASLWTFPMEEISKEDYDTFKLSNKTENNGNLPFVAEEHGQYNSNYLGEVTHLFSHLRWHILVFKSTLVPLELTSNQGWFTPKEFKSLTFPKPQQKMLELLSKNKEQSSNNF